jgi:hypothetical protein
MQTLTLLILRDFKVPHLLMIQWKTMELGNNFELIQLMAIKQILLLMPSAERFDPLKTIKKRR